MHKLRVTMLGALALASVVVFLVGPTEGRFAREATMVLIGVLAVIWHLALSGTVRAPVTASPRQPTAEVRAEQPLGSSSEFDAVRPTSIAPDLEGAAVIDLTDDQGALVSTESVSTESRAGYFEVEPESTGPRRRREVADLSSPAPPAPPWPPPAVQVPSVFSAQPDTPAPEMSSAADPPADVVPGGTRIDDPWLAFAASMFAPKE